MSDLIKAQATPQFNCYTQWTSLGANGMPGKLIKEDLKQPDWIEMFFKKGSRDNSGPAPPNQAQFGHKYFLTFTHQDFKSRFWLNFLMSKRNLVWHCSTLWLSVFRTQVSLSGPTLYSFFLKNTNVSQITFIGLFWPMGSYVALGVKVTFSSMFYVRMPLPWVCMVIMLCRQLRLSSPHSNTSNPWISCWYSMD